MKRISSNEWMNEWMNDNVKYISLLWWNDKFACFIEKFFENDSGC